MLGLLYLQRRPSSLILPIVLFLSSISGLLHAQQSGLPRPDSASPNRFAPRPSDVLTPNTRRNTPYLKIGVRAGANISSYSNDRYLDNVALDVGDVSGESDVYTSATGFGFQVGVDVEYPLNTGFSLLATAEFERSRFGAKGTVREPCVNGAGETLIGTSVHEFAATIDYLKVAGSAKFSFSSFYLTFGLTAEHPLSTSLHRVRQLSGTDCYYPDSTHRTIKDDLGTIPAPARLHYSLRTGLGLIYQLTPKLQFSPELTLDFGFTAINKSPNSDLGVYAISATIRYDL
jgi:hypothetical protein